MIERVEKFLVSFFNQEYSVHVEERKEDNLEAYNTAFEALTRYTVNDDPMVVSEIGFGITLLTEWHDEEFFEEMEFLPKPHPRYLYKISEYLLGEESIWACYASNSNPPSEGIPKLLTDCFIVREVSGELKVTTNFIPDYDTKAWKKVGGYDMEYSQLGEPVSVKRFLSPSNDEWSIEEFNRNA